MAERLRCARCRRPFTLTEPGWQPPQAEPQWRYRLAEVFWQLLEHNGDLPLRALREVLGLGAGDRRPAAWVHEHDLWAPGAEHPIELDICAQRGPELWIGEAKLTDNMGKGRQEKKKLQSLREAAELLQPHGIVLVTAESAWSPRTQLTAEAVLQHPARHLLLVSCPTP